jgi:ATP-dependent Lhr-like helicase
MPPLPFHPLVNAWFAETYEKPTPVQEEAWPLIAKGAHVLAIAPTGSGKTLTGFLSAISRFAEGSYSADRLSVLYVSPLKALNEDIRRNLILPLEGIRSRFETAGELFPAVRVETRSGDTPQSERRRFLSRPPSILALTPESLGIILLNPRGRQVLSSVRYVILDEIHTALGSKRGCFLSCQIDRLALVAGEFQRVALSATVKPPEAAADFVGGLRRGPSGHAAYEKRKVHIVAPEDKKDIQFRVIFPDSEESSGGNTGDDVPNVGQPAVERYGRRYAELIRFIIERVKAVIPSAELRSGDGSPPGRKGTVLVFTDSRRRVERINFLLNQAAGKENGFAGRPLSYAHHGSLSKDVRRSVEKALSAGEISCVVATGSLELGIDIGSVEEVILAGSPGSAAVALQRVGRSGHDVGMMSRGWLIPFHGLDLLQAAAISGAIEERELEKVECIENPLDVLSQMVLALCAEKDRNEDELYETIRGFYVYRDLSRASYDGVVRMLAGAYEESRLRELSRRIFRDDETGTLSAAPGALPLLYTSGGVIASRGYYSLRIASNGPSEGAGTKIGELDEEFVWERRIGDCFDFGNRSWRITAIGNEAVEAVPLAAGADFVPFWHADVIYRSPVISRRMLEILDGYYPKGWTSVKAEKMLASFSDEAKKALEEFLHSQWSTQRIPLSGPSFIPIEIIDDPVGRGDAWLIVFHSFKGGGVNFPLSLALTRDIEARYDLRVEGSANDNAVFIKLPRSLAENPASIIRESLDRLCEGEKGEERFRERLESSGVFGAAFREAAERALVLPRAPFGKRMPLWITRQKSKRLFDVVRRYGDFPATAEAWRTCLLDTFDMEGFSSFLEEIRTGAISLDFFTTNRNSPFSKELAWAETNELMYQYDERPDLMGSALQSPGPSISDQVIAEALGNAAARPNLRADLIDDFCSRLRREIPGWAPEDAITFCEWVKERIAIPTSDIKGGGADEWERLLKCIPQELADTLLEDKSLGGKLEYVRRNVAKTGVVVHREWAKKWKEAEGGRLAEECLEQWLRFEGPVSLSRIEDVFGLSRPEAENVIHSLFEQGNLLLDVVARDETGLVCDRENLELLLRLSRRKQRPIVKERPTAFLVPFLARRQGILQDRPGDMNGQTETGKPWNHLAGIAAPVRLWETEFFPCRCPSYSGEIFDREIRDGRLLWYGAGKEKASFCEPGDLDLVLPVSPAPVFSGRLPPEFFDTPRNFWEIKDALNAIDTGMGSIAEALWEEVWKGGLSADSWEPLRKALELGFTNVESAFNARLSGGRPGTESSAIGRRSLRVPRAIRERWRTGPPVRGNWFSLGGDFSDLPDTSNPKDSTNQTTPLEEEELNRDRVRLLLDRWGLLSRPLLEREVPVLSWSRLLPAMRRMELAGELVAGRFFGGVNSLQFASPRIAEELEEAETQRGIYWMNAADPASPAGLAVQGILADGLAPNESKTTGLTIRRVPSTRLCFRGAELVAISNKGGKENEILISSDDPDIGEVLAFLKFPRTRKVQPEYKIVIERINGKPAASSAYFSTLSTLGFVKDRGKMILW